MIQVPQLPGFKNPVHDAQTTFRNLLEALANPGSQHQITALVEAPAGLNPACCRCLPDAIRSRNSGLVATHY
jgi:alpha-D-ribose 1-methylphosphonate 5-triphosphate synthase subunit PhnH